ncbi:MAG: hypothetical protein AAF623_19100, partial [Planctomycetota bacterium]
MRTFFSDWMKLCVAFLAVVAISANLDADEKQNEDKKSAPESTSVEKTEKKELSGTEKLVIKRRLNSIAKTQTPVEGFTPVELFNAMDVGEVKVSVRHRDASQANVIVTNQTDKPLAIQMPSAFSTIPVLRQGLGG